jgi:hypothetical protein
MASDMALLFLDHILISRCHDIYHLGVLALLTGASGIRFSFFPSSLGACLLSLRDGQRRCPRLGACPCSSKQYRLSLSLKSLPKLLALPCHPYSIGAEMGLCNFAYSLEVSSFASHDASYGLMISTGQASVRCPVLAAWCLAKTLFLHVLFHDLSIRFGASAEAGG